MLAPAHRSEDAGSEPSSDPTGTKIIRTSLRRELDRRWTMLRSLLRNALMEQDLFGLSAVSPHSVWFISRGGGQVQTFQTWLDAAILSTVTGSQHDWLKQWIERGYNMGSRRAVHDVAVVDALTKAAHVELQGIAEAVSQQVVRVLSTALIEKRRAPAVFRQMSDRIRRVGQVRSRGLSNFAVVRAFVTGALDRLESRGVRRIGIIPETVRRFAAIDAQPQQKVEILTARDKKVCPKCEEIAEEGPYTIREARRLIPAHPNCRCAPVEYGLFKHEELT